MLIADLDAKKETSSSKNEDDFALAWENFSGNCTFREVHALLEHPNFNPSPNWISKKLGTTVEDAVNALEGLKTLGLVAQKADGSYYPKKMQVFIPPEKLRREALAEKHKLLSYQVLNKANLNDEEKSFFRATYQLSNHEEVKKLYSRIKDVIKEFMEESAKQQNFDGLYTIQITGANVLKDNEGEV